MWGKERRSKRIDEEDRNITAYHEAGHAILTVVSPNMDPLHKITIIPRGMSLGSTMFLPKKDRTHVSKGFLLDDLVVCMGGRVAEELFLKDICTGARQDLAQATQLARSMVCEWGMSDVLGPRAFGKNEEYVFLGREVNRSQDYSEKTAQLIDAEVDKLLKEAHEKATKLLTENKEAVEALAKLLLEKETVEGLAAEEIVKYGHVRTPEERGEQPPGIPTPPPVPADEPQPEAEQEQKPDND
jgi:cell division protease FtsH